MKSRWLASKDKDKLLRIIPCSLFLFLYFLALSWFRGTDSSTFFYIHDQGMFLPSQVGLNQFYVWSSYWLGTDGSMGLLKLLRGSFYNLLYSFGWNVREIELLCFPILFTMPAISMYFALKKTMDRDNKKNNSKNALYLEISAGLGALLYAFNLYLIIIWHAGHFATTILAYSFLPVFAGKMWQCSFYSHENSIRCGIFTGVFAVVFGATNPPMFVALFGVTAITFAVYVLIVRPRGVYIQQFTKFAIAFGIVCLLINSWWLIPYFYTQFCSSTLFKSAGDKTLHYVSLVTGSDMFVPYLQLFVKWTFFADWNGRPFHSFSPAYRGGLLPLLWFLVLCFSCTFFVYRNRPRPKGIFHIWFHAILVFVTSLLLIKGIKPPFGNIFAFLFENIPLFNMFRSPGNKFGGPLMFGLSIMFALSCYLFLSASRHKFLRFGVIGVLLISILAYGWPFITGIAIREKDQGRMPDNLAKIPDPYMEFADTIRPRSRDFKIFMVPGKFYGNYMPRNDTGKGYHGGDMLKTLVDKPLLGYAEHTRSLPYSSDLINFVIDNNCFDILPLLNVEYLVLRNERLGFDAEPLHERLQKIDELHRITLDFMDIYRFSANSVYPLIYVPDAINFCQNVTCLPFIENPSIKDVRAAVYVSDHGDDISNELQKYNKDKTSLPVIEYKKVNPIKYVVKLHNARGLFPLIFSESFHASWKIYHVKYKGSNRLASISDYRVFKEDHRDQASVEELNEYIEKSWATTLGSGEERTRRHKGFTNDGRLLLEKVEKYSIDYVSRNIKGTIQNENLDSGYIFDTWFNESMKEEVHFKANGYANGWLIDVDEICSQCDKCTKNADGSFDLEMIIEYWPQRLVYLGLFISIITIFGSITYSIHK